MLMDPYYAFQDDPEASSFFFHASPPLPELPTGLLTSPAAPPELPDSPARRSSFRKYAGPEFSGGRRGRGKNIHKRMVEVLGKIGREREERRDAVESSRGFRHMMRERQRRERLSQSYADLHAMLSSRSKGDKNSIVQSASIYIRELKGARDQLQRSNEELKAKILGHDPQHQCVKVQFEVDEPSSAVESMIGALRCLKGMDVKARGIQSDLSGRRLSTVMNVETTIAASEVEKAVEATLQEVERKQADVIPFPGSRGWPQTPHVENVLF